MGFDIVFSTIMFIIIIPLTNLKINKLVKAIFFIIIFFVTSLLIYGFNIIIIIPLFIFYCFVFFIFMLISKIKSIPIRIISIFGFIIVLKVLIFIALGFLMVSSNKIIPYEKIEVIEKLKKNESNIESIEYELYKKRPSIHITFYLKEKPDSCYFADLWKEQDMKNKINNYLKEVKFPERGAVNYYYGYLDDKESGYYFEPTKCIENVE